MYDSISSVYDRFNNWPARLGYELPFLEHLLNPKSLQPPQPIRVLDAACGTGKHAIALAQKGYRTAGVDFSQAMISIAQANAAAAGLQIPFLAAGFGDLKNAIYLQPAGEKLAVLFPFEALLCLGNSLPHVLSAESLRQTLADFYACLAPGGKLILQNRNFDAVLRQKNRWMDPQSFEEEDEQWIFIRFYDFEAGGLINFHIMTIHRKTKGAWEQQISSTQLRPLLSDDLQKDLTDCGFSNIRVFVNMAGEPFNRENSPNLIIAAEKY